MHYPICLFLLAASACLNIADRRMLVLTALVGASVFTPTPAEYDNFYVFCISFEMIVALVALRLKTAASVPLAILCLVLVIAHVMGYYKDGYPPHSPYRAIVPTLETLEILCCVLAAPYFKSLLRNRESP